MTPFQIAGIGACVVFVVWNGRRLTRDRYPRGLALAGMLLGAIGAVAIADPESTTTIARTVGINRGADLLTYVVALAFLGSWFWFYHRLRTLSNAVTTLVREIALQNARLPDSARAARDAGEAQPRPGDPG
jgi:hypothetical protein